MTDRELDALVAEKIFGCRVGWDGDMENERVFPWCDCRHGIPLGSGIEHPDKDGGGDVPNYSTDISAAWEVVEKMQERGFQYEICAQHDESGGICVFRSKDDIQEFKGDTVFITRSICLAALKSAGVDAA